MSEKGRRVLTCVYCGHEYPQDTPAWDNQELTDHIRVCPKHPLRQAEEERDKARAQRDDLIKAIDIACDQGQDGDGIDWGELFRTGLRISKASGYGPMIALQSYDFTAAKAEQGGAG